MGIPDHLICLLRNLYAGQEATVRTGHGTTDWFQIGKGVRQGCKLSPCLFNLHAEYIMRNAGLEDVGEGTGRSALPRSGGARFQKDRQGDRESATHTGYRAPGNGCGRRPEALGKAETASRNKNVSGAADSGESRVGGTRAVSFPDPCHIKFWRPLGGVELPLPRRPPGETRVPGRAKSWNAESAHQARDCARPARADGEPEIAKRETPVRGEGVRWQALVKYMIGGPAKIFRNGFLPRRAAPSRRNRPGEFPVWRQERKSRPSWKSIPSSASTIRAWSDTWSRRRCATSTAARRSAES